MNFKTFWTLIAIPVTFLSLATAHAELCGDQSSIEKDHSSLGCSEHQILPRNSHTVHRCVRPDGSTLHHMVNSDGKVFAMHWNGPVKPDALKVLMGEANHTTLMNEMSNQHHAARGVGRYRVVTDQFTYEVGGQMGHIHTFATCPNLKPKEVEINSLMRSLK